MARKPFKFPSLTWLHLVQISRTKVRIGVLFPPDFFLSQQANSVLLSTAPTLNEPEQKSSLNPISPQGTWLLSSISVSSQAACLPTLSS